MQLVALVMLKLLNILSKRSNIYKIKSFRKINPNLGGKDNWSPLEIAIQSGFFQIVNLLLEDKRIQINSVNSESRGSPLHIAAKSNYLPIC